MPGTPRKKAATKRKAAVGRKTATQRKTGAKRKTPAKRKATASRKVSAKRRGATLDDVRACAMALPGAEEGTSYGTPAWRVRGKLFARLHDSGEALVVRIDFDDREGAMRADPKTFFITDHYTGYPMMLVHLDHVTHGGLIEAVEESWRRVAPKRMLAEFDATRA